MGSWFEDLQIAFAILGAITQAQAAISADQPFTTPPVYGSPMGHKYAFTVTGTPVPG